MEALLLIGSLFSVVVVLGTLAKERGLSKSGRLRLDNKIVEGLESQDVRERRGALRSLIGLSDERAVSLLADHLRRTKDVKLIFDLLEDLSKYSPETAQIFWGAAPGVLLWALDRKDEPKANALLTAGIIYGPRQVMIDPALKRLIRRDELQAVQLLFAALTAPEFIALKPAGARELERIHPALATLAKLVVPTAPSLKALTYELPNLQRTLLVRALDEPESTELAIVLLFSAHFCAQSALEEALYELTQQKWTTRSSGKLQEAFGALRKIAAVRACGILAAAGLKSVNNRILFAALEHKALFLFFLEGTATESGLLTETLRRFIHDGADRAAHLSSAIGASAGTLRQRLLGALEQLLGNEGLIEGLFETERSPQAWADALIKLDALGPHAPTEAALIFALRHRPPDFSMKIYERMVGHDQKTLIGVLWHALAQVEWSASTMAIVARAMSSDPSNALRLIWNRACPNDTLVRSIIDITLQSADAETQPDDLTFLAVQLAENRSLASTIAIQHLATSPRASAVTALLGAVLRCTDEDHQPTLVLALGATDHPSVEGALLEVIERCWVAESQTNAAVALGQKGSRQALGVLNRVLATSVAPDLRVAITRAIDSITKRTPQLEQGALSLTQAEGQAGELSEVKDVGAVSLKKQAPSKD